MHVGALRSNTANPFLPLRGRGRRSPISLSFSIFNNSPGSYSIYLKRIEIYVVIHMNTLSLIREKSKLFYNRTIYHVTVAIFYLVLSYL